MKRYLMLLPALCLLAGSAVAGKQTYTVGLQEEGERIFRFSYSSGPLFGEEIRRKLPEEKLSEAELKTLNSGDDFAKRFHLETLEDIKIGDLLVTAGSYVAGFNIDQDNNFSFVIWEKDVPRKTGIKIEEHNSGMKNLAFMLVPSETGCTLIGMYGDHLARIPITMGEAVASDSAEEDEGDGWDDLEDEDSFSGF